MAPSRQVGGALRVVYAGAVFFFVAALWLPLNSRGVYNSPDEAASYIFINRAAQTRTLWKSSVRADNPAVRALVHPRSMRVLGERVVPAGFLGLPLLYGALVWALGEPILPLLTPLVAVLGILAFERVIAAFFGRRTAAASALLLFLHPAVWYYTARGLFHNILFVSVLAIGSYCFLRAFADKRWFALYAGLFSVWLALLVRPSEFLWVLFVLMYIFLLNRRSFTRAKLTGAVGFVMLLGAATYGLYRWVYGGASLPGVFAAYGGGAEGFAAGAAWRWLLPFGFHPRVIWWSVSRYYVIFLLPYALLTLGGMLLVWRCAVRNQRRWLLIFAGVSVWLFLLYGSWLVFDNPSRHITIGAAYLRYWLPSFLLAAPLWGVLAVKIFDRMQKNKTRAVVAVTAGLLLFGFSCRQSVTETDGVLETRAAAEQGARLAEALRTTDGGVPDNAVILTDNQDKYLAADFSVISPVKNDEVLRGVYDLLNEGTPVYLVTHNRTIAEWMDIKARMNSAGVMYTLWFTLDSDTLEVHALRRLLRKDK